MMTRGKRENKIYLLSNSARINMIFITPFKDYLRSFPAPSSFLQESISIFPL